MTDPRIVTVGIDGSETSSSALLWAAQEADRRTAVLRVVCAYAAPVYVGDLGAGLAYSSADFEALKGSHREVVDMQLEPVRTTFPELDIEVVVEMGSAVSTIVECATDAELVVVGSHRSGSVAAMVLGSVAHGVAHRSPCPAVLVPGGWSPSPLRHIVAGTDGSPAAESAAAWARDEAVRWGADVTVVHAWDYPYPGARSGTVLPRELMELDAATLLAESTAGLEAQPGRPGNVHARLVEGAPAASLIDAAADADLLVVGARGRGVVRAALLGSTSSYAIHHARCPVAVVKHAR